LFVLGRDVGRILIRAVTKDWLPQGATAASTKSPDFLGKEEHLVRVLTDLYNQRRLIIQSHEVLLIDDDVENVRLAQQFGHVAFKVEDDVELSDIASFVEGLPSVRQPDTVLSPPENASVMPANDTAASSSSSSGSAEANTRAEYIADCLEMRASESVMNTSVSVKSDGNGDICPPAWGELASEDMVQPVQKLSDVDQPTAFPE
jgi:hypothetical protein